MCGDPGWAWDAVLGRLEGPSVASFSSLGRYLPPPPVSAFMILQGNIERAGLAASFQAWGPISSGTSFPMTMKPMGKLSSPGCPSH